MFGKKKKEAAPPPEEPIAEDKTKDNKAKGGKKRLDNKESIAAAEHLPQNNKKKRKIFSKKLFLAIIILISLGVSGFVVYKIYFNKQNVEAVQRKYVKQELANIILQEEVIQFCFELLPEFYDSMIIFNKSIISIENEIKRLNDIGEKFPDQIKIAEKEIKSIEKEKTKLKQSYEKLEKKVEALYVGYKVNQDAGIKAVEEQKNEISTSSKDALTPILEITKRIDIMAVPEKSNIGFVKKIIDKIKEKL